MKRAILLALALAAVMSWPAVPLVHAQGNSGHKEHGNPHGNKAADDGWQQRDGWEYRTYGPQEGHPPGWSHGKKTGWGDCGMPPGQAKKYGCQTYSYQGRNYFYYQDPAGQIVVRRPSIQIDPGGISVH
jgi:hypothetical protein